MQSGTSKTTVILSFITVIVCAAALAMFFGASEYTIAYQIAQGVGAAPNASTMPDGATDKVVDPRTLPLTQEQRIEMMEKMLQNIKETSQNIQETSGKAEARSYYNKLKSNELVTYMRIIAIILIVIAIGFPLTLWLLSRRRLIGLSGLSSEITATLLVVEERQAKLANILRDIQSEVDYLHTMSVPDLKNLISQAENYLKQNENDLQQTGLSRKMEKPIKEGASKGK